MQVLHFESPAPDMPWGAKGAGEAGIIGPAPAIAAAVEDALSDARSSRDRPHPDHRSLRAGPHPDLLGAARLRSGPCQH